MMPRRRAPRAPLLLLLLLAALPTAALSAGAPFTARNVVLKANRNDYPPIEGQYIDYSSCWGYVHPDGREYALLGVGNGNLSQPLQGTAIYNVTDPDNVYQVGFIPGPKSQWREMKAYRNWVYVVTEGTGTMSQGLQIIRMTDPENPVLAGNYQTPDFIRSHTVSVDTSRALLFCNGTRAANGLQAGIRILSLANPEAPVEIAAWPGGVYPAASLDTVYTHDSVPVGNRLYAASIYAGIERVLDISNPAAPTVLKQWSYPGGFTHNSWPDATGNVVYVTDEVNGQPLKVFDISNLGAPVLANTLTSNPTAVIHNAHVKGSDLYLANYTEGIRVLDATDPLHPAEFAWADSWNGISQGFDGVWEVYPFFPSGTVIASDRSTGLYVYEVQRDYGLLRAEISASGAVAPAAMCSNDPAGCCCAPGPCHCDHGGTNAAPSAAAGAEVYLTTQGDSLTTANDGVVVFAPNPGTHTLLARKFGYFDAGATRTVTAGGRDTVALTLEPRPTTLFSGNVLNTITRAPLEGAEVNLAYTPVHLHTDVAGAFSSPGVPQDLYRVEVRRPGFVPMIFNRPLGASADKQTYSLSPAPFYDAAEAQGGWIIGDPHDITGPGVWVNADPVGTGVPTARLRRGVSAASVSRVGRPSDPGLFHEGHGEAEGVMPGDVQPEFDRTPGAGTRCFITGQSTTTSVTESDVDGGATTLTSPRLDCTGLAQPTVSYWHWFYSGSDLKDWLVVLISNNDGATYVSVDTTRGIHNHWMEKTFKVSDYVTPNNRIRVRFVAADWGNESVVEAAIDDLELYDGAIPPVDSDPTPLPSRLAFQAPRPNPSSGPIRFSIELPATGPLTVDVLDVQGRLVTTLQHGRAAAGTVTLSWDGTDERGRSAGAGLFFLRARSEGQEATTRLIRVR